MDVTEFEDWLDRLGDDISRWPDPQREAALVLLAESDEARDLLAEAGVLRQALAAPSVRAPAGLADRIVKEATRHAQTRSAEEPLPVPRTTVPAGLPRFFPTAFRPSPAVFLPLCFIVGILVGIFSRSESTNLDQADLPAYVAHVVDTAHASD